MTRTIMGITATGVALLLAGSGLVVAKASLAAAAPSAGCSGVPGDVNGDGHAEAAVGEPGDHRFAGATHVLYGTASGVVTDAKGSALDDQNLTESVPGVPGWRRPGDGFGGAVAFGDFNRDRCADLAVAGTGDETVTIFYGSPRGVRTAGADMFAVRRMRGPGVSPPSQGAAALAVGDFDGDGVDDLAIGADETQGPDGGGAVLVLYGDRAGLNKGATSFEFVPRSTPGVSPGVNSEFSPFARVLTAGDFDGDGDDEIVVSGHEVVQVLSRGPQGFARQRQLPAFDPASPGFPRKADGWYAFGKALAAGDVDGDGRDDLAIGSVGPGPLGQKSVGAVLLLRGSGRGLTLAKHQVWTQRSRGVAGDAGFEDDFGAALAIGRLDDGRYADLAVGAPHDDVGSQKDAGSVTVLLGSRGGLTTAGAGGTRFHQGVKGIAGKPEAADWFGYALATAPVQSTRRDNLLIGAPFESIGGADVAGQVHLLGATGKGPSAAASQTLSVTSAGVKGTREAEDRFGLAVG